MSHHSNDPSMEMFKKMFGEDIGATGKFPEGKLNRQDEGEIKMAVGVEQGKVVIHFGKPVAWVGFNRTQAVEIASLLLDHAARIKREDSSHD